MKPHTRHQECSRFSLVTTWTSSNNLQTPDHAMQNPARKQEDIKNQFFHQHTTKIQNHWKLQVGSGDKERRLWESFPHWSVLTWISDKSRSYSRTVLSWRGIQPSCQHWSWAVFLKSISTAGHSENNLPAAEPHSCKRTTIFSALSSGAPGDGTETQSKQ